MSQAQRLAHLPSATGGDESIPFSERYDHRMQTQQTPTPESRSLFSALNWGDWTLLAALGALLVVMCTWRSHARLLWADEMLGDRLLNRTSFSGMLHGWWEGADGGGLAYYLLGRTWVTIAGSSELALRLFSTVGMATAILLIWALARRYFSLISVAWAVALVSLFARSLRWQELNGRFYGLFFAAAALAGWAFVTSAEAQVTWRTVTLIATTNALLIGSHTLGIVYSAGFFTAMLARDRHTKRYTPKLYMGLLASWAVLLLSAHSIFRSTTITKHLFWTRKPQMHEWLIGLTAYDPLLLRLLIVLVGLVFLKLGLTGRLSGPVRFLDRQSLTWLCVGLLIAQLALFVKSRIGLSIYADRYLLPLAIVTVLVLSACFEELLFRRKELSVLSSVVFASVVFLPAAVYAFRQHDLEGLYPKRGLPQRMTAHLVPGVPVLETLLPDFLFMERYEQARRSYFLLDWPYDLTPGREAVNDYSGQREMENWRRAQLIPGSIEECPEVFRNNNVLYIFLDPGRQQWLHDRILGRPGYTAQRIQEETEWNPYSLWLVQHTNQARPPC